MLMFCNLSFTSHTSSFDIDVKLSDVLIVHERAAVYQYVYLVYHIMLNPYRELVILYDMSAYRMVVEKLNYHRQQFLFYFEP